MNKGLTRAERATIAEFERKARAEGRDLKVPRGVSGLPQPVWTGKQLIYPEAPRNPGIARMQSARPAGTISPVVRKRRARLSEMWTPTTQVDALAEALGCSAQIVRNDAAVLGLALAARPRKVPDVTQRRRDRLRQLVEACGGQRYVTDVAEDMRAEFGCDPSTVRSDLKAMGLTLRKYTESVVGRRADVGRLRRRGLSYAEIARTLDITVETVNKDVCWLNARGQL